MELRFISSYVSLSDNLEKKLKFHYRENQNNFENIKGSVLSSLSVFLNE